MASAFIKAEGNSVKNRLWDFLIVHEDFDYAMKDIARLSGVGYTSLKDVWKEFVDRGIVTHTRDVGRAKMYRLNRNSPQVEAYVEYYWTVTDAAANEQLGKKTPSPNASRAALPASAKSF